MGIDPGEGTAGVLQGGVTIEMSIRIDPHTLSRANERGASEEEIIEALETGVESIGKKGRRIKAKVFPFGGDRNGKTYPQKRIEVVFVVEGTTIITVTVYVFYGKWSDV